MSPRPSKSGAVLAAVKGKSLRDGLRPPLTAAPRSAFAKIRSGRGDVAGQSNKEMPGNNSLDTNRPIQVQRRIARLQRVASGRTGVRAKAVIPLRARNRLHRSKRALRQTLE